MKETLQKSVKVVRPPSDPHYSFTHFIVFTTPTPPRLSTNIQIIVLGFLLYECLGLIQPLQDREGPKMPLLNQCTLHQLNLPMVDMNQVKLNVQCNNLTYTTHQLVSQIILHCKIQKSTHACSSMQSQPYTKTQLNKRDHHAQF